MLPVERLHLDHVLQTVSVLESVVLRSFGPEGGQMLFIRDTGQAMLSRSGTKILTALRLEHPLARMVVECVLKHSAATGDGSKTFILLLASLLRMIHTTACKVPNVSHMYNSREAAVASTARRLAKKLVAFAFEELDDIFAMGVAPYGCCLSQEDYILTAQSQTNNPCVQKLLATFFHSRLGGTHSDLFSHLTSEMLINWIVRGEHPSKSLHFIYDNLPALHTPVSGFSISCSRLIEGQVIHRDFAAPCPQSDQQPVKAVILTGFLHPEVLCAGEVLQLGCEDNGTENSSWKQSIMQYSTWAESSLECAIARLRSLGVSVILSAVKQSAAALALAAQAEICIVECISEDELFLFGHLSGVSPVTDCRMIKPDDIALLTFCRPILLGSQRYVHVAFQDLDKRLIIKPCSLIICGAGEGQTDQYVCAFRDAIRMQLSTWRPIGTAASKQTSQLSKSESLHAEDQICKSLSFQQSLMGPGCVVPAGGTFELLLHHALLQHGRSVSGKADVDRFAVSQILANALLSIPKNIYSHSSRRFLETQTRLMGFINKQKHNTNLEQNLEEGIGNQHCCREINTPSEVFMLDLGLESLSCKYQLLLAVLQCVSNLLQVDTLLHINTTSHT
ncbi:Bardet-Biedl syndrome 10 protein isoform X1 [Xyrichtys novacula]|uniref:Bardet-Biedl syndrome 10 protein isoform X1 n=1 Tax=Xyrichtys novacula TaxID=13765 RepID=A0AAV1F8C5_XYRNO|nr:Bardet-Biedl syndrome 10 protein isoform X1 [Xyrichtys novacula]